jgi:Holliday junction DNA helicase RuvA
MISSLNGKLNRVAGDYGEIEVNGVGYLVYAPAMVKNASSKIGQEIKVFTYMAVSENDISLYGFETGEEVDIFKLLISVSGVGPKTGAQILSNCKSLEIIKAIGNADVAFFEKIKGIGKKTAQRIIVDLKSKIGGLGELDLAAETKIEDNELTLSLKQLGFERKEVEEVLKKLPKDLEGIEEQLAWCLQNMN